MPHIFRGFILLLSDIEVLRDFLRQGIMTDIAGKKMAVHIAGSRKQGAQTFRV